jgi:hypothetical protein
MAQLYVFHLLNIVNPMYIRVTLQNRLLAIGSINGWEFLE